MFMIGRINDESRKWTTTYNFTGHFQDLLAKRLQGVAILVVMVERCGKRVLTWIHWRQISKGYSVNPWDGLTSDRRTLKNVSDGTFTTAQKNQVLLTLSSTVLIHVYGSVFCITIWERYRCNQISSKNQVWKRLSSFTVRLAMLWPGTQIVTTIVFLSLVFRCKPNNWFFFLSFMDDSVSQYEYWRHLS